VSWQPRGGLKAILDEDEDRWHGEDLADRVAHGFSRTRLLDLLGTSEILARRAGLSPADTVPFSYWRKRKNVPRKPASVDASGIRRLEQNLSNYFHKMQGRGENCKWTATIATISITSLPTPRTTRKPAWSGSVRSSSAPPHHPALDI
jgi:hypothetical protein